MLSRFVRIQLIVFTTMSIIGVCVMATSYLQVPTLLGLGRYTVTLELPSSGGLYRFANVTYRGVQIGKVTDVVPTGEGAEATLVVDASPSIPADLQAEVRSISAVGEQYVDLRPRTDSAPYLHDGSVISVADATVPQQVGPMLDRLSTLVDSIPKDRLGDLLDEAYKAFNGTGNDFASLFDSSAKLSADFNRVSGQTEALINDAGPLLDSQAQTADSIQRSARSLAGFTAQLTANDPQVRALLQKGPGAFDETTRLLDQVKPTLPVLLANLTSIGQIGVTYHPSIEQLLVLLPNYVSQLQTFGMVRNNPTGATQGDFTLTVSDPPACTVGFLPPSQWRSPTDLTEVDTPDGLYCKLPQDSPIGVRGARNYPCMGVPGKRAPTVQACNSDQPFMPVAQRQHTLGPYPLDPNLIAQGLQPDHRVNPDADIYGPLQGTPLPAGVGPPPGPTPPVQSDPTPVNITPATGPLPGPAGGPPPSQDGDPLVAPSSFVTGGPGSGPSVAVANYDPRTGQYVGPDGRIYQQTDLVAARTQKSWKDLLPI